jgi:glucokinase
MTVSYAIGIDVGGSSLKCGLVNEKGAIVHSFLSPLNQVKTEDEIISLLLSAIKEYTDQTEYSIAGVGIGFPGIVENGIIIGGADNLPGFVNLDLVSIISANHKMNVVIDNDANMMGWGEKKFGAGKNCSDVVFLTTGTGIGGGLIINGQIYGGYKNRGTELGHIMIQHQGRACSCGGSGCFEAYGSVTALLKDYALLSGLEIDTLNGKMIVERYLAGEAAAISVMQQHFDYQATGIASLINVFSPQKVILGGGITESGDFYVQEIKERVLLKAMPDTIRHTEIVAAALGNHAGLLGAAGRVFELEL